MMKTALNLLLNILSGLKKSTDLALKNLALRQQLTVMKRFVKRPQLLTRDRLFWVLLSRFWNNWQGALIVVMPETVVRWHRKGFKVFWRFKSRGKGPGRPPVRPEIRDLILKMAKANPLWGCRYQKFYPLPLSRGQPIGSVMNGLRNFPPLKTICIGIANGCRAHHGDWRSRG